jgi:hypothetical protein
MGLSLALALLFVTASAPGQPPPPPDYKIAFWYRRADPFSSMRHQAYDVRKGEYTAAVADWLRTMHSTRPDYDAYLVEFRLDPLSPDRDKKQLATVILNEYLVRGGPYGGYGVRDRHGIYGAAGLPLSYSPAFATGPPSQSDASAYVRGYGFVSQPGANRTPSYAQPPGGYPMPMPYPYVRPHP